MPAHFAPRAALRRARMALAYLQEALQAKRATPAIVAEVREYLEALPREPERARRHRWRSQCGPPY